MASVCLEGNSGVRFDELNDERKKEIEEILELFVLSKKEDIYDEGFYGIIIEFKFTEDRNDLLNIIDWNNLQNNNEYKDYKFL